MSETGSMALTLALSITAFSADALGGGVGVAMLPIIAFLGRNCCYHYLASLLEKSIS